MVTVLTEPDDLNRDTEVVINEANLTFALVSAGNLADTDVKPTGVCFYSFFIDELRPGRSPGLLGLPVPFDPITPESFILYDWEWADDATRRRLARVGWSEVVRSTAAVKQTWFGVAGYGSVPSDTPAYYILSDEGVARDFDTDGIPTQAIKVFGDATHGNVDYRSSELTIRYQRVGYYPVEVRIREQLALSSLGAATQPAILNTSADPKSTIAADAELDANDDGVADVAPYSTPTITVFPAGTGFAAWANATVYAPGAVVSDGGRWYQTTTGGTSSGTGVGDDTGVTDWVSWGEVQIDGTWYPFQYVVDNAGACDIDELYTLGNFWQRQTIAVDVGASVVGRLLPLLMSFTGDTLYTAQGVGLAGVKASDVNSVFQRDATGVLRSEPYVAAITVRFGAVARSDPNAYVVVYVAYGTSSREVLLDASGQPMSGPVNGASEAVFSLNFDGNSQQHTAGQPFDAVAVVVGQGVQGHSASEPTTITRSTENAIAVPDANDRVYLNPA